MEPLSFAPRLLFGLMGEYYLLFGNPWADPTPALILHINFTLTPGRGDESGRAFLSYLGDFWLACPDSRNPYNNLTQYSGINLIVFFPSSRPKTKKKKKKKNN